MDKSRLEAFSDGVFAVVVTLLVLGISLPTSVTDASLKTHLLKLLPSFGAFILSFMIAGMYWVAHHLAAEMFKKIDTRVMWLNILHLAFVCLIPFTASLLSRYGHSSIATTMYGINILCINLAGWLIVWYLYTHQTLAKREFTRFAFRTHIIQYSMIATFYTIGIICGLIHPVLAIIIYLVVTVYLIIGTLFPNASWRRHLQE